MRALRLSRTAVKAVCQTLPRTGAKPVCQTLGFVALIWLAVASMATGAGSDVADAARRGDRAAVQKLIASKADVNAPQVDGATALHWAVYRDDAEMTDVLIRAGANVQAVNRAGATPLAMASLYGSPAMIDRLLKAGADAKQKAP